MLDRLEDNKAKQVVREIPFYLSLIGFGLIIGAGIFRELREILIMEGLNRLGINYCELSLASQDSFRDVDYMFASIIMYILIIKFILVICYLVLRGERKRIIYYENVISIIIGIASIIYGSLFPTCLIFL